MSLDKFGWRCRGFGNTHIHDPSSTIRCEWCDIVNPFEGDKHFTRPTLDALFAEMRRKRDLVSNQRIH